MQFITFAGKTGRAIIGNPIMCQEENYNMGVSLMYFGTFKTEGYYYYYLGTKSSSFAKIVPFLLCATYFRLVLVQNTKNNIM